MFSQTNFLLNKEKKVWGFLSSQQKFILLHDNLKKMPVSNISLFRHNFFYLTVC